MGTKFRRSTFLIVNLKRDEISFPVRSFTSARQFVAAETAVVGLSANNQNKIGPVQSVEHPPGPTFFWCPSDVLISLGIHAVRAESLGQAQHTLPMLGGVVL